MKRFQPKIYCFGFFNLVMLYPRNIRQTVFYVEICVEEAHSTRDTRWPHAKSTIITLTKLSSITVYNIFKFIKYFPDLFKNCWETTEPYIKY